MSYKSSSKQIFAIGIIFLSLTGCATSKVKSKKEESVVTSAASQPFKDFGLMKKGVPPILAQITDPYGLPEGADCSWIKYQISELDNVLGPDAYRETSFDDRSLGEKSGTAIEGAAKDAVKGAFSNLIPGRGLIRKVSGAEKADREYNSAINLGNIRRGYLKGVSNAKNCS